MLEAQITPVTLNNRTHEISVGEVGLKAGSMTFIALIAYFMIMKYFSFMDSAIAWGFNFIILFIGIFMAYNYYRSKTKPNIDYLPGLTLGGITTAVSVLPFTVFVYFFFLEINPVLMLLLKDNPLFMGEEITAVRASGATMIEGLCSGVIASFIMMQYFRSGFRRARKENVQG